MKQITTVMVKRYPGTQRHLGILVKGKPIRYGSIGKQPTAAIATDAWRLSASLSVLRLELPSAPVTDRMYSQDNGEGLRAKRARSEWLCRRAKARISRKELMSLASTSHNLVQPSRLCSRTQPTPLSTHTLKASPQLVSSWKQD
ncbi:hypothetical protein WJX79_002949 [Trebouxia sp. C0005]